jgi:ATP-dependent RNA helicase DeaD
MNEEFPGDAREDAPEHESETATSAEPTFADLGLGDELLATLAELGYEEPTPVQREAIPVALSGADMVGQAATGTGKTAAFALPVIESLDGIGSASRARPRPQALILVPTRELAMQVSEAIFKYGRRLGVAVVPIYGGQPIGRQLAALDRGVHVVVGTPGRVLDHVGRGSLDLDGIRTVVLDEADEMLDMGFADDLEAILGALPDERQTMLFSATMPPRIDRIVRRSLRDPVRVTIERTTASAEAKLVTQRAYVVARMHKPAALGRVLDIESPNATIVFCRTRTEVDELTATMAGRGYRAEALHGGMDQPQRDRVMGRLRDGIAELLVATDVAARGLDVDTLTHVVNYNVPSAPESYVHRIGRVGRAGREGVAITLAEPRERRLLSNIERVTGQPITVEPVPSVADLRARQAELTVESVRDAMGDGLDDYRAMLDTLTAGGAELATVAAAALRLVHEERAAIDDVEIPVFVERERRDRDRTPGRDRDRDHRPRNDRAARPEHGAVSADGQTGFVYVGVGRKAGVRPADLVGAVANESGLPGRQIGPIRISEHFSVVGVPVERVDEVVAAMRSAQVRGKPVTARRWSDEPAPAGKPRTSHVERTGHRGQYKRYKVRH